MNIREIAKLAGVSIATVSRAINAPQLVQPQTLAHIQDVMQQTGYAPVRSRPRRQGGCKHAVLFLFNEADYNFYEQIQEGFETVVRPRGYVMLFCQISPDAGRRAAQIDAILRQRPAGVIWALRDFHAEEVERFAQSDIPLVLARKYDSARPPIRTAIPTLPSAPSA